MRTERVDTDAVALTDQELRDAYERGRVDERSRHKRNWLMTILGVLLSLVGIVVLALAALNGSFQRAGGVIDRQLSIAADQAEPAVRNAANEATDAVRGVGDNDVAAPAPGAVAPTSEAR